MLESVDFIYLRHVLRMTPGQQIETFDGNGRVDTWEIAEISRRDIRLEPIGHRNVERTGLVRLMLGLNPLKAGNEETAVRMAAAMGVEALPPVGFKRSDVPVDKSTLEKRLERWRKLCIAEVAQSGGAWLPEIREPVAFENLALDPDTRCVLFYEEADIDSRTPVFEPGQAVVALVGPEGGLTPEEVQYAIEQGMEIASLGPWTLRADLAGALVPSWVYSRVRESRSDH